MDKYKVTVEWNDGAVVIYKFINEYYMENFLGFNEKQIKHFKIEIVLDK